MIGAQISAIPIAAVTEQQQVTAQAWRIDEVASEFSGDGQRRCARLITLRMLPRFKQSAEGEEEEADRRKGYRPGDAGGTPSAKRCLADMKQSADLYWQREPMFGNLVERTVAPCTVQQLLKALAGMTTAPDGKPAAFIEPQAYSVQDKMADILQKLQRRPQGFMLNEIFTAGSPAEKVACFLGVLELLKLGLITISQAQRFAPIYIFGKQGQEEANDVS